MSLFHCFTARKPVVGQVHAFRVAGGTVALCSDLLVIGADARDRGFLLRVDHEHFAGR
jgi:hypothetical protein